VAGATEDVTQVIVSSSLSSPIRLRISTRKFDIASAAHAGHGRRRPIGLDYILSLARLLLKWRLRDTRGAVAQLGERLICIQEVAGSIPTSSTSLFYDSRNLHELKAHPKLWLVKAQR
jgi:hypothetical protein